MSIYDALSFLKSPSKIRGGTLKQIRRFVKAIVIMILMHSTYGRESSRMKSTLSESRVGYEFLELF